MLKDLMQRKTARREKIIPVRSSNRDHSYTLNMPTLTVPKPVLKVKREGQVLLSDGDACFDVFEPLERVRSRKDLNLDGDG